MCGRYSLTSPAEALSRLFRAPAPAGLAPRYNIAPTQTVLAVRLAADGETREMVGLRWGLIPSWAKDPEIGNRLINARAETVAEKPSFRASFRRRRCLVPASGFYEWRPVNGAKQPYHCALADGAPFAIAGLWERWSDADGAEIETCTLLTTEANALLAPIHARMPVIVAAEDHALWLDVDLKMTELLEPVMRPFDPARMAAQPVSRRVNNVRNDDTACLEPHASG